MAKQSDDKYNVTRLVTVRIRQLNDRFRRTLSRELGFVQLSDKIKSLPDQDRVGILSKVMYFRDFDEVLDPYYEHNKGYLTHNHHQVCFKIDYCDPTMCYRSEDPTNPEKTIRVLSIMLVEEVLEK